MYDVYGQEALKAGGGGAGEEEGAVQTCRISFTETCIEILLLSFLYCFISMYAIIVDIMKKINIS